jgi:hypothetical protein
METWVQSSTLKKRKEKVRKTKPVFPEKQLKHFVI